MELLKGTDLERVVPSDLGISTKGITDFINEINEKHLGMHSFTIVKHGKIACQCFWKPFDEKYPHILYSVSKSFTSTAVGIARGEGLLDLDDKIVDYFPEYKEAIDKHSRNKVLTLRHLLTMHSGKHLSIFTPRANADWIEDYFSAKFTEKPNVWYDYVSENTFMCSAIVKKVTGMSCRDYLYEKLFAPLGIEKPEWEHDGLDNSAGGWGLYLRSEDIAKAFLPYLNGGRWLDGTQLIPEDWTKMATTKQVDSYGDGHFRGLKCDNVNGYGFQFWINSDRKSFRAEGLYGQRCVFFPEDDALVVINSGQSKDYEIMDVFWKYFPEILSRDDTKDGDFERLQEVVSACKIPELPISNPDIKNKSFVVKADEKSNAGFLPIMMNLLSYNKPSGYSEFRCDFKENNAEFTFVENGNEHTVVAGMNGEYGISKMDIGDLHFDVYSKAYWKDERKFVISMRPIQTCHEIDLEFDFKENSVSIKNLELPNFEDLAVFYLTFTGKPIRNKFVESEVSCS